MPMQQVSAYGMSPAHVAPFVAERIILKEEMVFAFEVDQTVRIIRPVLTRRKVVLRPVGLIVTGRIGAISGKPHQAESKQEREGPHTSWRSDAPTHITGPSPHQTGAVN